jgi:hypothetical protein
MKVFAFEGTSVVYACGSLTEAEEYFEAIDVEDDEYVFFGADGTVVSTSVVDGRVVLTATERRSPGELRRRLRAYLEHPGLTLDPALAEDPAALADVLMERQRASTWPRWPAWLRIRRSR